MDAARRAFRPHQFRHDEPYVDLWHVYDNLSVTPFQHGIGIECFDPDTYFMDAWHVIEPEAIARHLDWSNREPTQFISFYADWEAAQWEAQRRQQHLFVSEEGVRRDARSVRIAHVRLPRDTNVWAFSRAELLEMMRLFGGNAQHSTFVSTARSEWFVWGVVPEELVVNRHQL